MKMTKWIKQAVVAASICAAMSASAGTDDEINALKAEINSNSVDRTIRCRYYQAWYVNLCSKAEREAILDRNVAAHKRWIELVPGCIAARAGLGMSLAIGGRDDEAVKVLSEAISAAEAAPGKLDQDNLSESRWALAEILWRRGDTDGAKKLITDIATMPWKGNPPRSSARDKATFLYLAWNDPDADIDHFGLPHSQDGKPFPTPREAKYGKDIVSLAKVTLKTVGIKADDPIARLLKKKLTRYGTKFEKGGTRVTIEISPDAPVDKPQGYSLDVTSGKVFVKARTRLGATYGVVSLIQCVDRGDAGIASSENAPSVKVCSIRDWPKLEKRGVISHWDPWHLEYELFNKMSSLAMDMFRPQWGHIFSELEREVVRMSVARRNDFGIDIRWADRWIIVEPMLALSSPRVRAMHLAWFRYAASFGAGIWFDEDDSRYPLRPEDVAAAGTSDKLDAKYIDGLYKEVKAEFPDFRMTFGPPFYFAPDAALVKSTYPEPREPYLESLRKFLDSAVDVYWSGPRVKSAKFTPEKIKWFSDYIGRKQVVYHNSDCNWKHWFTSYGADVPGFKESHCPETLDMIGGFYQNTSRYCEACRVGPAMDWCWNPEAHESKTATIRTIDQLEGPGVFEILSEGITKIEYFDKYPRGIPHSELFTEDQDKLDKIVLAGDLAWKRAMSIAKSGGKFVWDFYKLGLGYARQLAKYRRNPPKWLKEKCDAEMANTEYAEKEVGYEREKGDIFLPCELLSGGKYWKGIGDSTDRKPCGVKELLIGDTISGKFEIEPYPPEDPPMMYIVAQSFPDAWEKPFKVDMPDFEVEVNGRVLYRGKMFPDDLYKPFEIELPVDALQRNNTFSIKHTGPDIDHKRRPMLHYVVVKKSRK